MNDIHIGEEQDTGNCRSSIKVFGIENKYFDISDGGIDYSLYGSRIDVSFIIWEGCKEFEMIDNLICPEKSTNTELFMREDISEEEKDEFYSNIFNACLDHLKGKHIRNIACELYRKGHREGENSVKKEFQNLITPTHSWSYDNKEDVG